MIQYIVLVAVIALAGIAAFRGFGRDASTTVKEQGTNVARMGF